MTSAIRVISCLLGISGLFLLAACQPVPEIGSPTDPKNQRPVKPLWPKNVKVSVKGSEKPSEKGFKIADPSEKPTAKKATTPAKSGTGQTAATGARLTPEIQQRLEEADDKAASARSMAQSAATEEDWELVIAQWNRAIGLIQGIPQKSPQVQQQLTAYRQGLAEAQRGAAIKRNPALAPVDPRGSRSKGMATTGAEEKPDAKPNAKPNAKPEKGAVGDDSKGNPEPKKP
jgi:hypothetical protein